MPLSKQDALMLREGDVVLVPMRVVRTNNHFDSTGVKVVCLSPQSQYSREEREKGPAQVDIQSNYIHGIFKLPIRVDDRVEWDVRGTNASREPETGKVLFIDGDDITVRQDKERTPRNRVILKGALRRCKPKESK